MSYISQENIGFIFDLIAKENQQGGGCRWPVAPVYLSACCISCTPFKPSKAVHGFQLASYCNANHFTALY